MKLIKGLIPYILIIGLVLIVRTYLFVPILVNGDSMAPTLEDKELLILNRFVYNENEPKRFDLIVFDYDAEQKPLVKRIVGLPGEKVEYKNSNLYIDDVLIKENFIFEETEDFTIDGLGITTCEEDTYFVMGDNRDNSTDSRIIGCVKKEDIIGKVNIILYPLNKFKIIK